MGYNKINLKLQVIVAALFVLSAIPLVANALPAFPGAEGWGSQAIGGRGGVVLKVTNLNDSGAGSLRAALTASGPRIVIFTVGGTITLTSYVEILNPYLTVAGQTAPGGGILIRGPNIGGNIGGKPSIAVNTHDVIIRGLKIRDTGGHAIEILGNGNTYNVIIDHCSMSWSNDTVTGSWGNPHDFTFSYNIFSEGIDLGDGNSESGGMLIGGYNACETTAYNITMHHNLFAHNQDRNPLIKQKIGSPEVINNLIYNWQWFGIRTFATAAIIGNSFIAGRGTTSSRPLYVQNGGECPSLQPASVYVSHNIGQGRPTDTGDDWTIVSGGTSTYRTNSPPFALSGVTVDDVNNVKSKVLSGAGATVPSRDAVDTRIINDVNNGTGNFITNPSQVGGWPTIAAGTYPTDTDGDGIPDSWETSQGLNPNNASDAVSSAPSGYKWIEEYINSLILPLVAPPSPDPTVAPPSPPPTVLVPNPPNIISIQ